MLHRVLISIDAFPHSLKLTIPGILFFLGLPFRLFLVVEVVYVCVNREPQRCHCSDHGDGGDSVVSVMVWWW